MPPKTFGQDNADAKVKVVKKAQEKSENPKFKDMVIDAITTQKERSGSSLSAIKNHLASKYKVDLTKKSGILNRLHQTTCTILGHFYKIPFRYLQAVEKDGRRRSSCTRCPTW